MKRSAVNYTGNKFKIMDSLLRLFPKKINNFYDLFAGSLTVSINVSANNIIANDYLKQLIDMYEYMKISKNFKEEVFLTIKKYNLSDNNKDSYILLRNEYNKTKNPLLLYVLICHSFNNQIRFNKNGDFNLPFGNRTFNKNIESRLDGFIESIKNIDLYSDDFYNFKDVEFKEDDFIYLDPPYLNTVATYNDGWSINEEVRLYEFCDHLNKVGVRFALSNVFKNNGITNESIIEWSKNYKVHYIKNSYNNCSYRKNVKNKSNDTTEVLITNY